MKKVWEEPKVDVQIFVPNEYVAACVTGTIQCAIPGNSPYEVNDGIGTRNYSWGNVDNSRWNGPTLDYDGQDHGICGEAAAITFSDSDGSGSGYEMNHGVLDRSRPIYNITGYTLAEGTYDVTWNSNSGGPTYNHYGVLTITNIDNSKPNHS